MAAGRPFHCGFASIARSPLSFALNAWLRRSWVWCLVTGCQLSSGRTQPSVWRRFSRPIRCLGRGAIRRKHRAVSACSVFWFLAPWVALVQSIGSRHSALGAAINCRAAPASNQSQQFVAYGHRTPLSGRRCARRYWPGICEFLAGAVQRPWHRVWLQRSFTLVIAKAGKFAVWFGCHNGQRCWYSWRAPVLGPSVSNGNRAGSLCVLVPFAIRRVGASCPGEGMRSGFPGSTTVVNGH
mgnify:CR=1 FL=1